MTAVVSAGDGTVTLSVGLVEEFNVSKLSFAECFYLENALFVPRGMCWLGH